MNNPFNSQNTVSDVDNTVGSTMPAFSGAFWVDSARPALSTDGQMVQQYAQQMYGQAGQQYVPPM